MTVVLDCPECGEIDSLAFEVEFDCRRDMDRFDTDASTRLVKQECDCSFYEDDLCELEEAAIELASAPDDQHDWYADFYEAVGGRLP